MKKRFFIQIEADFLLDIYDVFTPLSPWLYLHLKFKQSYFPNKAFESGVNINTSQISRDIGLAQSVVWPAVKDLISTGLISKLENKMYFVFSEKNYLETISKTHIKSYDTKNAFFQISYDFFKYYWDLFKGYDELKIYYYFLMKNNHFLFPKVDKQLLTGNGLKLTNIWKELKIHRVTLMKYIKNLKDAGLIEIDENGNIYTFSESFILKKSKNLDLIS